VKHRAFVARFLVATFFVLPSAVASDHPVGPRYLVIHADDAGMCHSVNMATIEAMEKGIVTSCSIMVPCPWFTEFAAYTRNNSHRDYGIHLTLNSEWKYYRWGPVAPREKVLSLIDKDGYLWGGVEAFAANAKANEVEIELRAQIDRAKQFGVPISHLDTHMGALVSRKDLLELFARLGLEYNLPVLWFRSVPRPYQREYPALAGDLSPITNAFLKQRLPLLDALTTGVPDGSHEERKQSYLRVIHNAPAGVNEIIIHCGIATDELKGCSYSWKHRDEDRQIFTDPAVIDEVKKSGVQLISWRQLREIANGGKSP